MSGAIYLAWLNPNGGRSGVPLWQNAITGDTDGLTTPGIPIYLGSFLNFVNSLDGNANFPLFTTTYTTTTLGNLTNAQLDEILGDWGVDTANHDVWAVIDHNTAFAVAAVPEPADTDTRRLRVCRLAWIRFSPPPSGSFPNCRALSTCENAQWRRKAARTQSPMSVCPWLILFGE